MAETDDPKNPRDLKAPKESERVKADRLFPSAGSVKEPFRAANPAVFGRTDGNVDAVRRVAKIEARVGAIRERLHDHVERHRKMWIADEAGRLLDKRTAPSRALTPKPNDGVLRASLLGQAQRNVESRTARRFTKLNQTKKKMQNTIVNTNPEQQRAPEQKKTQEQDNKSPLSKAFKKSHDPKL